MKKRRIIIAVISIIVVAAMVLFDMLYMKKDKKEELPQEEKKVEEIVWITESSIEGVQSEMEEALNALLKKRGCEYKVRFVCFPMETYEEDVAEYLENNSADIIYSNLRVVGDDSNQYYSFYKNGYLQNSASFRGYYVHKLTEGRKLILGGVDIPWEKGLLGHSDADVLIHAIMDALLGAAALGDIGKHFPDTDPAYKGISSIKLLEHVGKLLDDHMYVIENIDATIIAQRPKMRPHIEQMEKNIAEALHIETNQVNVKATTEEGLGFTGSGEGISSQAICAIEKLTNFSSVDVAAPAGGCAGCGGCAARQM